MFGGELRYFIISCFYAMRPSDAWCNRHWGCLKTWCQSQILFLPFVPAPLLLLSWRPVNQSGWTITDMQVVCWVSQAETGWQAMGALRLQAPFHCQSRGWFGGRWWCKAAASNRMICRSLLIDDKMTNMPPPTTTTIHHSAATGRPERGRRPQRDPAEDGLLRQNY